MTTARSHYHQCWTLFYLSWLLTDPSFPGSLTPESASGCNIWLAELGSHTVPWLLGNYPVDGVSFSFTSVLRGNTLQPTKSIHSGNFCQNTNGNRYSTVKWSSKCPSLSRCWDQRELLCWGWRQDGIWSVMIHLLCQYECTLRKNRAMGIKGRKAHNARAKQLCSRIPSKKAEKGRERNHFTTSKKNEHNGVLEL